MTSTFGLLVLASALNAGCASNPFEGPESHEESAKFFAGSVNIIDLLTYHNSKIRDSNRNRLPLSDGTEECFKDAKKMQALCDCGLKSTVLGKVLGDYATCDGTAVSATKSADKTFEDFCGYELTQDLHRHGIPPDHACFVPGMCEVWQVGLNCVAAVCGAVPAATKKSCENWNANALDALHIYDGNASTCELDCNGKENLVPNFGSGGPEAAGFGSSGPDADSAFQLHGFASGTHALVFLVAWSMSV